MIKEKIYINKIIPLLYNTGTIRVDMEVMVIKKYSTLPLPQNWSFCIRWILVSYRGETIVGGSNISSFINS